MLKVVRHSEQITTKWSGGTTTQLFIYPENSSYTERNFLFRISKARIETAQSNFTKLPGISRTIMVLDGILNLEYKNHYSKTLKKFESDHFSGDWDTVGHGKATDFNVMTSQKAMTLLRKDQLEKNESIHISSLSHNCFLGYYPLNGHLKLYSGNQIILIDQNDFIMIYHGNENERNKMVALEKIELVIAEIRFTTVENGI